MRSSSGGSSGSSGSAPPSPGPMVSVTPTLLFRDNSLTNIGTELKDRFTVTNNAKDRITVSTFRSLRSYKYTLEVEPSMVKVKPVCVVVLLLHVHKQSHVDMFSCTIRVIHKCLTSGLLCTARRCWIWSSPSRSRTRVCCCLNSTPMHTSITLPVSPANR